MGREVDKVNRRRLFTKRIKLNPTSTKLPQRRLMGIEIFNAILLRHCAPPRVVAHVVAVSLRNRDYRSEHVRGPVNGTANGTEILKMFCGCIIALDAWMLKELMRHKEASFPLF